MVSYYYINRGRSTTSAFTLVELLAVIAIISILSAIVITSVGKVRESANSAACLSNLRQIASAATLYSGDNRGRLVPIANGTGASDAYTWRGLLMPYLGNSPDLKVLRCPSDVNTTGMDKQKFLSPPSYGINVTGGLHDYLRGANTRNNSVNLIRNPSNAIFVSDIGNATNPTASPSQWDQRDVGGSYGYATFPSGGTWSAANNWNAFPRHKGRVNAVFYDGHACALDVQSDLVAHPPGDPACLYYNGAN